VTGRAKHLKNVHFNYFQSQFLNQLSLEKLELRVEYKLKSTLVAVEYCVLIAIAEYQAG